MSLKYLPAFAALSALIAQPAAAEERIVLAPSSSWVVNYDADSCALQREFGADGQQVFLELRSFGPNQPRTWQVIVASANFSLGGNGMKFAVEPLGTEPSEVNAYDIKLGEDHFGRMFNATFSGGEEEEKAFRDFVLSSADLSEDERSLLVQGLGLEEDTPNMQKLLRRDDYTEASDRASMIYRNTTGYQELVARSNQSVTGFLLVGAFSKDVFLKSGDMTKPQQAMSSCLDELMGHWGVDVAAHKSLTRKARPANIKKFASDIIQNYPMSMVRAGLGESLHLRLNVSAEGRVTGCHLQMGVSDEVFQQTACKEISQQRFLPALDANGNPIASYFLQAISYRLN